MYARENLHGNKNKGGGGGRERKPAWHSSGMTSNFFQTLVKIEQRGKKEQRPGKMADQSLKELDAEQTCQERLVPPFSKNTNINNPGNHSHLFLSLSRCVNFSITYITAHASSWPLCFLTAASIYYSVHFCNLWHYIRLLFLL